MDELQALAIAIARATMRETILEHNISALEGQVAQANESKAALEKQVADLLSELETVRAGGDNIVEIPQSKTEGDES